MQPLELRWFMDTNEEVRQEHDDHLRKKTYAGIINYNFVETVVHEMELGVYVTDLAKIKHSQDFSNLFDQINDLF